MKKTFYLTSSIDSVKSVGKSKGLRIAGYANTIDKDRQGDVVLPTAWVKGVENYLTNPVLLFQHKPDKPIGRVEKVRVDQRGLFVEALVSDAAEKQHNIHTLIKDGALKSFSVGFRAKDGKYDNDMDATTITELELLEISVVSIPANHTSLFSVRKNFSTEEEYKTFCAQLKQQTIDGITKDVVAGITSFDGEHYHTFEVDEAKNGRTVYTSHGESSHTHEIIDGEIQEADGHSHSVRVVDLVEEENMSDKGMQPVYFETDLRDESEEEKPTDSEQVKEEIIEEEEEKEEEETVANTDPYDPIPFENCLCAETSMINKGNVVSYNDKRYVVTKIATMDSPTFTFKEVDINNIVKEKTTPIIVEATKLSVVNDWDLGSGYDVHLLDQEYDLELNETQRADIKERFEEAINIDAKEIYDLRSLDKIKQNKSYQEKVNRLLNLKLIETKEWTDTNFVVANHVCDTIDKLNDINLSDASDSESECNFALLLHGHKIEAKSEEENKDMATQLVGDPQVVKTEDSQPEKIEAPEPRVEVSEPRVAELVEEAGKAIEKQVADEGVIAKSDSELRAELEEIRQIKSDMLRHREELAALTKSKMEYHDASRKEQFTPKEMADAYFLAKALGKPDDERVFETKLGQRMKAVTTVDAFLSNFSSTVQEELEQELIITPMLNRIPVDARNFRVPVADEDTDLNVSQFASGTFALSVDDTTNVATSVQNSISAVTFTPHKFMAATHIARDEEEDTVLPLIGFLRAGAARRMARAIDKSILRGDGTLTGHTAAPSDFTSVITGMVARAEAVAGDGLKVFTGANGTAASAVNIATARTTMGKYGLRVNSNDLVYITSVEGYNELVQTADFRTVDTFGPQATYHTGTVGSIWGIPVMISEFMDNKGTSSDSNNSVGVLVYKPGFLVAERRGVTVESEYEPRQQITAVYMSTRLDMQALTTVASAALSNNYSMAVSIQTGNGVV